ncbi:RnfABCDGE type electron transport complex subunit D [Fodinisporobacter ferrooxydans]|uniref:RnfABCDGE type electron transport complex subunit D n=1 Tax=Fodinisporobacter ferrooxydans TaxID=2901836 RepID=A0ABY4CQ01_9BACL|nr:RnfABCDGE type electron transport complex subunit D [Alicyclobacillaceae bacterium MYW30-H2]
MNTNRGMEQTLSRQQTYSRKQTQVRPQGNTQKQQRKFLMTPKLYVMIVLIVMTAIAGMHAADRQGILNACAAIVTALLLDLLIGVLQKRNRLFSDGGVITGLIVALVLSSMTPWYICALTTGIAIVSKHVLKIKRKPILNPAAFGLLAAILLFSSGQSWWGAMSELPIWSIAFLLVGGFLVTSRVNKFPQAFSFLAVYFILLLLMGFLNFGQAGDALRTPFINSALFMAFFMLTDPPTSPGKYKDQVVFGCITAIVGVAIFMMFGGLTYLFIGLLAANVWNAYRIYKSNI